MTVGELLEEDSSDIWAILYATYLRYTQDDNAKAIETLWPIKEGAVVPDTAEKQAVYLWLSKKVGLLPQEARNIRPTLQRYYEKKPGSYLLLYLLHQESEDTPLVPAVRLRELETCFNAGCMSPFLYLAAWELLQKEEALLRELSPFFLQVLCFGQKQGRMTEGLLKRMAALSAGMKTYSNILFRLLTKGYERMPDDGILEAICQLLAKGDPIRRECFPWYARAVDRNIRMTRLYEFYMETYDRPAEDEIPQPVRMYFATNHTLGSTKRALLYASVILHREEEPTDYENYARSMRNHALDSLQKGKIDRNYAILYKHFFSKPETPEIATLLTKVLFVQRIAVREKCIRQVVVCHNALKKETVYPCRDGVAYPRIYSEDACLLFEDDQHRRFVSTVHFVREPMFAARDIAQACMYQAVDDPGLELYLCHEKAFQMDVNSRSIGDYRMAEKNPAFTDAYRRIIRRKLLEYALEHPEQNETVLPADKIALYAEADRPAAEELLIREGRYEEAFRVISEYGFENVPVDLLQELAQTMIETTDGAFDEELLYLTAHVYAQGVRDADMLTYLRDHYEGPQDSLSRLWRDVHDAGIDSVSLEDKILSTAVRIRKIPEHATDILSDRIKRGGDIGTADAYLTFLAGQYFLGGVSLDASAFAQIDDALAEGRLQEDICKLAVLKHAAEEGERTTISREHIETWLKEENGKGFRFAFYQKFPEDLTESIQIEDKVVIEAQFHPDARVILHYQITEEGGDAGEWISEPMPQVYDGIFHQEFQLFAGDTIRYDLRVMMQGKIRNMEPQTITVGSGGESRTRYALLNRMRKAGKEGDREALKELAQEYAAKTEASGRLLSLIRNGM